LAFSGNAPSISFPRPLSGPHSASENSLFDFVETAYGSFVFGGASAFQVDGRCATKLPFGVSPVSPQLHLYEADPAKVTERTAAKLLKVLTKELDRQEKQQRRQECLEQEKRAEQHLRPHRESRMRLQQREQERARLQQRQKGAAELQCMRISLLRGRERLLF
jgi:hypothetical protein